MELKSISINERMSYFNVTGLSIALIENGQISFTEGFGVLESGSTKKVDSNSIFNACSISKFVTTMLVMKLTEHGFFDLDEDVNKKLSSWKVPENEFTKNTKVTLRKLLSHQAGIIDPEGSFTELRSTQSVPSMVEILEGRTSYCNEPIEVKYEPGSDFQYSDAGFCIVQQLIEDSIKKPFEEIMNQLIFEPLNMKNSRFVQTIEDIKTDKFSTGHNKNGELVDNKYPVYPYPAAAGLWTTPRDLSILSIELMNALKGESRIGLSADKAREIINSHGCKKWTGLGVFLDGTEHNVEISSLGWGEGFQCMMVANPYLRNGAVIMTNTNLGVHQMNGIIGEIYHSLTD